MTAVSIQQASDVLMFKTLRHHFVETATGMYNAHAVHILYSRHILFHINNSNSFIDLSF